MSKLEIGYDIKSKQGASKVVARMKQIASKDGRLGEFTVEKNEEGEWSAFHTLTAEEQVEMSLRCARHGQHAFHLSGVCMRCHAVQER